MQLLLSILAWGCAALAEDYHPFVRFPPNQRNKASKESIFSKASILLEDYEVPTVVTSENISSYIYFHQTDGPLTIIIRPCSGSINVNISHIEQNYTDLLKNSIKGRSESVAQSRGMRPHVFSWPESPAGLYPLSLLAENRRTIVTLFATREPDVPAVMRIKQRPRVRITPRLHRDRVTVRWDPSFVDPHQMNYYVVVNSRKNFSSLCEAYSVAGMNVTLFNMENGVNQVMTTNSVNSKEDRNQTSLGRDDVFLIFVGSKTSYTMSNLQKKREYFFNIFAENNNTKLSLLYASKTLIYDPKVQPVGLRDNKPETVNIRRFGGKASFRYKVSKLEDYSALSWYVMPCGAPVQVEIRSRRKVVIPRRTVRGYAHLQIPHPKPGQRYVLRVFVTDPEHMRQISGVQVLATINTSVLPELPYNSTVYEFASLRTCNSVTVGWLPALGQSVRYCVSATPVNFNDFRGHFRPLPNQCNLDFRLSNQLDFAVKQCQDFSANDNRLVLIETLSKLVPAKDYLIEVTVKKIKGKALSYNLLRVQTNKEC